jgi:hypothetical protein
MEEALSASFKFFITATFIKYIKITASVAVYGIIQEAHRDSLRSVYGDIHDWL